MKAQGRNYDSLSGLTKLEKISESIILIEYDSRQSLCSALVRFEEHYEGAEYRGKIFTLGEYRRWYCLFYGAWTYEKDWSGFNIPAHAFKPFFEGLFDPLTDAEAEIVEMLRPKAGNYCVIGTFVGGEPDVFEHEICHAMFSTNGEYKAHVLDILKDYEEELVDLKVLLKDVLGYGDNVILDECHAYICESSEFLIESKISFPEECRSRLQELKAKYRENLK